MTKWIDLKVRQPKHGQLVVVSTPKPGSTTDVHLEICAFGTSQDWRFPPELNATHWYPLPAIREEPDQKRERLERERPDIFRQCQALEVKLHNLSPLIDWTVDPVEMIADARNILVTMWRFKGVVSVNGLDIHAESEVSDYIIRDGPPEYLRHIIMEIAYALAQGILK